MLDNTLRNFLSMYTNGFKILDFVRVVFDYHKFTANKLKFSHLCYRCDSQKNFEDISKILDIASQNNISYHEATINGRIIKTYLLKGLISYNGWNFDTIELCQPKENNRYPRGFCHVAFVSDNLNYLVEKNPSINFDVSMINDSVNPTIEWEVSNALQIKFHILSLIEKSDLEKSTTKLS
jgi:predicted metalloenzyme YecM